MADAPRYYLDKGFLKKTQIPTAPYIPQWIVDRRAPENQQQKSEEPQPQESTEQQIQLQNNAQPVQAILPPQGQGVFAPPTSAPTFQPPPPKDDLNG